MGGGGWGGEWGWLYETVCFALHESRVIHRRTSRQYSVGTAARGDSTLTDLLDPSGPSVPLALSSERVNPLLEAPLAECKVLVTAAGPGSLPARSASTV